MAAIEREGGFVRYNWEYFVYDAANIKGLASLVEVDLLGSGVTDAGLVHLNGLTNLSELGRGNPITDVGLRI